MKNFKLGFTLAEVLITLGIIGVVAAIVMPTVMTSHQYAQIGVKLSKFMAQTENAARAYAVTNDEFTADNIATFMTDTFVYADSASGILKDGTVVKKAANAPAGALGHNDVLAGSIVAGFDFQPMVAGLPKTAREKTYRFAISELGFVYPDTSDTCLTFIAKNDYKITKAEYQTNCTAKAD